jgi:hypothetical protein
MQKFVNREKKKELKKSIRWMSLNKFLEGKEPSKEPVIAFNNAM